MSSCEGGDNKWESKVEGKEAVEGCIPDRKVSSDSLD